MLKCYKITVCIFIVLAGSAHADSFITDSALVGFTWSMAEPAIAKATFLIVQVVYISCVNFWKYKCNLHQMFAPLCQLAKPS